MTRIACHGRGRGGARTCLLLIAWLLFLAPTAVAAVPPGPHDPAAPGAHPGITRSAWVADPGDAWSPREALAQAWTPYQGALARGYTEDATWIRLTIDPAASVRGVERQRLVLVIEPPQLDEVGIWLASRIAEPLAVVGDTVPPGPGQPGQLAHAVALPDAVEPFEVLLRVRNRSSSLISLQVLRWDDAIARDADKRVIVAAFLVFDLVVALGAGLLWLDKRDLVLGLFIVHQLTAFVLTAALQGLVRSWTVPWLFSPGTVDVLTSAAVPAYTGIAVLLNIQLMRDFGAREPERRWLPLGVVPSVFGGLLMILGFRQLGLLTAHAAVPLLMAGFMVVAWRCRPGGSDPGQYLGVPRRAGIAGAYALMTALTLPQSLRILGLHSDGSANYSFQMYYAFVSTLLMAGLLRVRAADRERRRRELADALDAARQAARIQQERATEQSELLTLLAHELKTPLSVVSLALDESDTADVTRAGADRAVRAMKDVIDRCTRRTVQHLQPPWTGQALGPGKPVPEVLPRRARPVPFRLGTGAVPVETAGYPFGRAVGADRRRERDVRAVDTARSRQHRSRGSCWVAVVVSTATTENGEPGSAGMAKISD